MISCLTLIGCSSSNNRDIDDILKQIKALDLNKTSAGTIRVPHTSSWDMVLITMSYLGTDEVLKLVDINERSIRLLEKNTISSEWVHLYFITGNEIVSYTPIKRLIEVEHPGYFIINRLSNQIRYDIRPSKYSKIKLSLNKD
jgi:hypothetical protein